jgi:hypothetical protein
MNRFEIFRQQLLVGDNDVELLFEKGYDIQNAKRIYKAVFQQQIFIADVLRRRKLLREKFLDLVGYDLRFQLASGHFHLLPRKTDSELSVAL